MAKSPAIARQNPTDGMRFANSSVTIEAASHAIRLVLRATAKGAKEFGRTLGLALPTNPGSSITKAGLTALWIGPDEWIIIDEKETLDPARSKREGKDYCMVDISHRNTAFVVSGDGAANTINAGCPRDLSLTAFPVGSGSRTVFGKAEIVLLRTAKTRFRVECWRSFAPYVKDLLLAGSKDAHIN